MTSPPESVLGQLRLEYLSLFNLERFYYAAGGAVSVLMAVALFRTRPKKVKLLQNILHPILLLVGLLLLLWSVDPRGIFEIYPFWIIMLLKDTITTLLITCALAFFHSTSSVVLMDQCSKKLPRGELMIGIPAAGIFITACACTAIAVREDQEIYRAIWLMTLTVILSGGFLASVACIGVAILSSRRSRISAVDVARKQSDSILTKKLGYSTLGFFALAFLEAALTYEVISSNQGLINSQLVGATSIVPVVVGTMYLLGCGMISYFCWNDSLSCRFLCCCSHSMNRDTTSPVSTQAQQKGMHAYKSSDISAGGLISEQISDPTKTVISSTV